ncbi:MAG: N-acetylmuramoyl-L-alanine amidase, partial [Defluviitaleaceae bacterium]|nr:N-acetylmuramoyl-L-alanine amidase [Defluviitaleaceae bacterium]
DGVFALNLKKRRALAEGDQPFSRFTFVIDAGHGGGDTGAIGPMGLALTEKDINLINADNLADRLAGLGARVIRTRVDDSEVSLRQRVELSREINPDMFISMHANSVAHSTDATNIRGITYWHRNTGSKPLADHFMEETFNINPLTNRNRAANQANFYVCRPAWSPSVIVEASFICNIEDFSWLIDPARQNELADGIVRAILSYYRQ